ncbi:aspartate carbamoyltransferase [Alkaliphilus transvaalensis]|uniref:aspartate carbamoyltransferase n=1 Tax=Alkaliphilus transvaalensis TaxID=114628 RepID=UPI00047C03F2|nr:aspartate carbamoyltransferase [Alkaliphilus transvaalensis]
MTLNNRHLVDPNDLTLDELHQIIDLGLKMYENPKAYREICKGKILGTLFYEPSTRTRLSFESAMLRLGGTVLGFSDANTSSAKKGESIADTIRVLDDYADILVMRHPREGAPRLASEFSTVPIINGGDGGHQHPTQTLTDLITIQKYRGSIENLKVAFCGDLLFGRTVHSLLKTLSRFPNISFVLVSPPELKIPYHLRDELLQEYKVEIIETSSLDEYLPEIDILYMTRIQKERFFNEEDYIKLKDSYILNKDKLKKAKEDLLILHPLPRVNEISYDVDDDPRAKYFDQAKLGIYVRMALMALLLGVA